MASSKIDRDKVEALVDSFLNIIEGTLNTVDQIAELNTELRNGEKVIKSSRFRLNIRNLKVKILEDLQMRMAPDNLPEPDLTPEPPKAS